MKNSISDLKIYFAHQIKSSQEKLEEKIQNFNADLCEKVSKLEKIKLKNQ